MGPAVSATRALHHGRRAQQDPDAARVQLHALIGGYDDAEPHHSIPLSSRYGHAPTPRRGTTGRVQLLPRQPADVGKPAASVTLSRVYGLAHHIHHGQGVSVIMIDVMSRLGEVKVKTAEALRASEADERASVVLVAVVREFDSKADKANRQADSDASARDSVIELEQAGDSAKAAAEADPNLGESARQAVLDAHLAICILKTEI